MLVNNDAQITVPPPILEEDEENSDAEEVQLKDAELSEIDSEEEPDEIALEQLEEEDSAS
jgi:hypothetical protein